MSHTTTFPAADARARLNAACEDRYAAARAAKKAGATVVAYAGPSVPVELIEAAGCVPVMLTGDPRLDTPLADEYLDDDFDGDIRALFQLILGGGADFADLIIIPRSSNQLLHLYYLLLEAQRLEPRHRCPPLYLFDILNTPFWSTGRYVHGRVLALRDELARRTGTATDDAALRRAIADANATRRVLQDLNARRRLPLPTATGSDMLRAIAAASALPRSVLRSLVAGLTEAGAGQTGPRLMVKGAAHDTPAFYELVESLGAVIVADDHLSGERIVEALVNEDADPVIALAEHYQLQVPTIRSYPQAEQDARFMALVEQAGVQGVIFMHDEFDDTLGWDYPQQKRLLDARGIPSVLLPQQSYRHPDRAAQAAAVSTLLSDIAA